MMPPGAEPQRSVFSRRRGEGGRVRCVRVCVWGERAREVEGVAQPRGGQLIARYDSDTEVLRVFILLRLRC